MTQTNLTKSVSSATPVNANQAPLKPEVKWVPAVANYSYGAIADKVAVMWVEHYQKQGMTRRDAELAWRTLAPKREPSANYDTNVFAQWMYDKRVEEMTKQRPDFKDERPKTNRDGTPFKTAKYQLTHLPMVVANETKLWIPVPPGVTEAEVKAALAPPPPKVSTFAAADSDSPAARLKNLETKPKSNEPKVYKVQPGDTLSGIATKFKISADAIAKMNNIPDPNKIKAGDTVKIPIAT